MSKFVGRVIFGGVICFAVIATNQAFSRNTFSFAQKGSNFVSAELVASTELGLCEQITGKSLPSQYFPLEQWKVKYKSLNPQGKEILISGLYSKPATIDSSHPWMVYQHGTKIDRNDAPSRLSGDAVASSCYFGSLGLNVVAPDFIGFGDSNEPHPYLHAETESSAGLDFLLALVPEPKGKGSTRQKTKVFVSGYSQGGHASMALHRTLEKLQHGNPGQQQQQQQVSDKAAKIRHSSFEVMAAVHMAGPYDLGKTSLEASLSKPSPYNSSIYAAYIITAYQDIYGGLYQKPQEIFNDDFVSLPDLFRAQVEGPVKQLIPALPTDLMKAEYIQDILENPNNQLRIRMTENNVYQWIPRAPTLLVYSGADDIVIPENAFVAQKYMKRRFNVVEVENAGDDLGHGTGFQPSFNSARRFVARYLSK